MHELAAGADRRGGYGARGPRLAIMTIGDRDTFAVIAGGAAAALTGLLFVAISLRFDYVTRSRPCATAAPGPCCCSRSC